MTSAMLYKITIIIFSFVVFIAIDVLNITACTVGFTLNLVFCFVLFFLFCFFVY